MKTIKTILILTTIILNIAIFADNKKNSGVEISNKDNKIFSELDRIQLKIDTIIVATITDIVKIHDGFVLAASESLYTSKYMLIKVSKNGDIVSKYDKRGNGPGELGAIENICFTPDSIFASERIAAYIHEYSHKLEFKKDHRVKRAGKILNLGSYMGIWSLNYSEEKTYILALYDSVDFKFKKFAFEIVEVPAFVQRWGGIFKVDDNTFAGIYPTEYQIKLFDKNFNFKKNLINLSPKHVKKYSPWKKSPYKLDNKAGEWIKSWSKMHSIFYVDGKYVIKYVHDKKRYLDIISKNGDLIYAGFEEDQNSSISLTDGMYIWKLHWNEDRTRYHLIKEKLNL